MAAYPIEQGERGTMSHSIAQNLRGSSLTLGLLGTLLTLVAPTTALAQVQVSAESPDGKTTSTQESAGPVAAPAPSPLDPALASQIEQATQEARIANRRVELLEEQIAAKAKEPSSASADEKGFAFRSADKAYVLKFHTLLQTDSRWFLQNGALSDKADTFLIRRFRPGLDGTLLGLVNFKFTPDFAGGSVAVFDAYADVGPFPWLHLVAGKFKSPLGLERLQSDADLAFIERALTQNLTPQRDVGVALWGEILGGLVVYHAGIYNGNADGANTDVDANHAKDFVGRLLVQPFKLEGLGEAGDLGLHFAASTGNRLGLATNAQLPSYKSGGQNTIFAYNAPTGDTTGISTPFAHLRQTRFNPGLFYYYGPVGVLGEFVWSKQGVQKGNTIATLKHQAAHATASVVIGGRNGYGGATPNQNLDLKKGTWGALEIAARWNYLKIDSGTFGSSTDATLPVFSDPTKNVSKAQAFAGGANYLASRALKLAVDFEQTHFTGGQVAADKKTVVNRTTENVIVGRLQLNF
jgi:phosphate-selective porin OprO/OprP